MATTYNYLSQEQIAHFLKHGYVVIKGGFSAAAADEFSKDVWVRLGLDPADVSTWSQAGTDRVHMPKHTVRDAKVFAPKVWGAICELLGGEERVDPKSRNWSDEFIVNLGRDEKRDAIHPRDLDNWHVDGDFFVHFLDSQEQGLLVIPMFTDIEKDGGATYISPEGMSHVARYLAAHPEGCHPTGRSFTPSTALSDPSAKYSFLDLASMQLKEFVELTGEKGDVVLLHPLMLHSASPNYVRAHRVITNPPVSLLEPFVFARDNPEDYSLVERKTLMELGLPRLDFAPTTSRDRVRPKRLDNQSRLYELETQRLKAYYSNITPAPPLPAVPAQS